MEAADHILSKMREPSCFKGKIPVERVDADFRYFADRLDASIKREREAVGNAAANLYADAMRLYYGCASDLIDGTGFKETEGEVK